MSKSLATIFALVVTVSAFVMNVSAVNMYAPDGRTIDVQPESVAQWQNVGWYTSPVKTMYAPDGRNVTVYSDQVAAWEAVGWFSSRDEVVQRLYAPGGKTLRVYKSEVPDYLVVGWYDSYETLKAAVNKSNYVTPAVNCEAADEFYYSNQNNFDRYVIDTPDPKVTVVFTANELISDFKYYRYGWNGTHCYVEKELYSADEFKEVALDTVFYGVLPYYGISYVDREGIIRHYAIGMSGNDGSLCLYNAWDGNTFTAEFK